MFFSIAKVISTSFNRIYDWVLPPLCLLCGYPANSSFNLCEPCHQDLPILPQSCQQCAQFLPLSNLRSSDTNMRCGKCIKQPPPFNRSYALFPYKPPIQQWIIQLKFQHQLPIAHTLGQLMAKRIQQHWYSDQALPDLIIPVPLHFERLRERGFNQALEIARPIAKTLKLPLDYHRLKRSKNTRAQSGLPAKDRKQNIAQAFNITGDLTGLKLAIIDDVITTGETIMECCHVLKKHGAAKIDVWCCARNG